MFDKSVVLLRLAKLDEYVSRLKRFEPVGLQEYLGNQDMQAVVERYLQLSIQVCIDIANYIIARKRLSFPIFYRKTRRGMSSIMKEGSPLFLIPFL
ncbi:hypothetical protein Psfp_03308 [Pelotomaculum sp. FP]|uniref:DUF86 domain-containing protein n=1 Tax=Pelotomaculum sp. FP TaxID=261474 RepID=UPI001101B631|nr:HepT-like ribonuclease domain-containing protein [Pelotomaculum sp. FP]TEB13892.1 hypothetical protein Psfp_03308 [Pelotomaculum sp. FP]